LVSSLVTLASLVVLLVLATVAVVVPPVVVGGRRAAVVILAHNLYVAYGLGRLARDRGGADIDVAHQRLRARHLTPHLAGRTDLGGVALDAKAG
jgi:hypothetical protein